MKKRRPTWAATILLCLFFAAAAWIGSYITAINNLDVDYVDVINTVFVMDYMGNIRHYDLRGGEK